MSYVEVTEGRGWLRRVDRFWQVVVHYRLPQLVRQRVSVQEATCGRDGSQVGRWKMSENMVEQFGRESQERQRPIFYHGHGRGNGQCCSCWDQRVQV